MDRENTVLIVDKDIVALKLLSRVVRLSRLRADTAADGEEALRKAREKDYALLLADIHLEGTDCFKMIKRLRGEGMKMPILVLARHSEEVDIVYALDIGADDYVTKPVNPFTLGAKLHALIRRSRGAYSVDGNVLAAGPFRYDTGTLRLYKNDTEITLTGKENAMMKLFLDNVNHVFPKETLYERIWGDVIVDDNAVMVYINRLRQKIEDQPDAPRYIQTVRGIGYRFVV